MILPSIQRNLEGSAYFHIFFGGTDFVIACSKDLILPSGSKKWLSCFTSGGHLGFII